MTHYDVVNPLEYEYQSNVVSLQNMDLYHGGCTSGVRTKFSAVDFVRQRITLRGVGRSTFGRTSTDLSVGRWSAMVPGGESGTFDFEAGYEEALMVVDDKVLRSKLGALIDTPVDRVIFTPSDDVRSPGLARYRRLLTLLMSEIEVSGTQAPGPVINEIAEALLVSFLHGQTHNFSKRLAAPERSPSRAHQRLAEDYIAERWNMPLSIEELAKITNVSARSIFRSFKDTHGCSPFQYVKRLRLQHARAMLLEHDPDVGVINIALKCGFQSLGHFANSYRNEFGELPSQTARR